jgi:hypothetical protein
MQAGDKCKVEKAGKTAETLTNWRIEEVRNWGCVSTVLPDWRGFCSVYPAMNRWAAIKRPCGTRCWCSLVSLGRLCATQGKAVAIVRKSPIRQSGNSSIRQFVK